MAFQPGHKHGAKSRLFDGALRRAIAQDDADRLRQAAEKLLDEAAAGKPWALMQLADRLDGKAEQSVTIERKDVGSLSLAELAAEIADIRAGSEQPTSGADGALGVH